MRTTRFTRRGGFFSWILIWYATILIANPTGLTRRFGVFLWVAGIALQAVVVAAWARGSQRGSAEAF